MLEVSNITQRMGVVLVLWNLYILVQIKCPIARISAFV